MAIHLIESSKLEHFDTCLFRCNWSHPDWLVLTCLPKTIC